MTANIAKNSKLPIAIFSLEMSKEQLSLRLLALSRELKEIVCGREDLSKMNMNS